MQSLASNNNIVSKIRNLSTPTNIALSVLFIYFLGKSLFFALNVSFGISPDETTWYGKCLVFSKSFFLPTDTPESYEYGLVTHTPYLYFWLMGKFLHLNIFAVSDLVFLRYINVCIGFATLWFGWKTIQLLTTNNLTRVLFIVLCSNTLMLTFLGSFVSYDNLVNFFAVASLYFLLKYFENRSVSHLLTCVLLVFAGCLTKLSFLPFAALIFLAFLVKAYRRIGPLMADLKSCALFRNVKGGLLMALCLFMLALNINLHGGNVIEFKKLQVSPVEVVGLDNALKYRIFARGYIVGQFKSNRLGLMDAGRMVNTYIRHNGDRADALNLLNMAAAEKKQQNQYRVDRFRYAFPWAELNMSRAFGVAGHMAMLKTGTSLIPYMLIFILGAALMIRHFKPNDMNGYATTLLVIFLGYTLIIMQLVNYKTYHSSGALNLALSGRYLFPVIYTGYALLANYLTSFRSRRANMIVAAIVAAVFIAGEFPWFLSQVTPRWYFVG